MKKKKFRFLCVCLLHIIVISRLGRSSRLDQTINHFDFKMIVVALLLRIPPLRLLFTFPWMLMAGYFARGGNQPSLFTHYLAFALHWCTYEYRKEVNNGITPTNESHSFSCSANAEVSQKKPPPAPISPSAVVRVQVGKSTRETANTLHCLSVCLSEL